MNNSIYRKLWIFVLLLCLGTVSWLMLPTSSSHPISSFHQFCVALTWPRLFSALYSALQLFALNFSIPSDVPAGWQPPLPLNIVRFLAPGFLATTIILQISKHSQYAWTRFINFFAYNPRYLIVGYGRVGQGLAKALKKTKSGVRIVVIDHNVTPLDRQDAKIAGVNLYEANARDPKSIHSIPFSLRKATRIFVAVGNDQQSIATAATLEGEVGEQFGGIWLHLNDRALLDRLRNASGLADNKARKIKSFSLAEALGTQLIAQRRPVLMARTMGQNRMHAVLIRFDDYVWSLAEALLLNGTMPPPRLARPRLTIIDANADLQGARWQARHPELYKLADITFIQSDPASLAWAADEPMLQGVENLDPPTLYIFGRSGDGDAFADALSLRHGIEKGCRQPVPIFVTTEIVGIENLRRDQAEADFQDRLFIMGNEGEMARYSHAIDPLIEQLAKSIDTEYGGKDFKALSETMQASNRRAALHLVQVMALIGFENIDVTAANLGLAAAQIDYFDLIREAQAEKLGGYEHLRWCMDRTIDGWRTGDRDDEARRRPQLEAGRFNYASLDQEDIDKDKTRMRALANFLNETRKRPTGLQVILAGIVGRNRTGGMNTYLRIVDAPKPIKLCWSAEGEPLRLFFAEPTDWQKYLPTEPDVRVRIRLFVPPEPVDIGISKKKDSRIRSRQAAYKNFAEELRLVAPKMLCFRFTRARAEGWNWLGALSTEATERIDGVTLPPLTVGFAGVRHLAAFGPSGELGEVQVFVADKIKATLVSLSHDGRPMRLVTGVAEGADQIMIDSWRTLAQTKDFPILGLYPAPASQPDPRLDQIEFVSENLIDDERHVEVARRILDSCDVLIAVYDKTAPLHDGGTRHTVKCAIEMGFEPIRILLAPIS